MFTVDEKTTFIGITDLRTAAKKMLQLLKKSRVVITERNAPRAVVIDYDDYRRMQELIELAEAEFDAAEVLQRKRNSKDKFFSHEAVLQKLSLD